MKPTLSEEKKLWKKGYQRVACLDEAGRGPLAGPVVAGVVMLKNLSKFDLDKIKDSKQLTAKKREEFYRLIIKNPDIEWGMGKVSEKVIDKINILEATKLAMIKAIGQLSQKPDFLILDGKMVLKLNIPQKSIVKGDTKVFSCACASVIAKVTRDRMMKRYHKKYPKYAFNQHMGYPTKLHRQRIRGHGPCQIHRKSFILYV